MVQIRIVKRTGFLQRTRFLLIRIVNVTKRASFFDWSNCAHFLDRTNCIAAYDAAHLLEHQFLVHHLP